MEKFILSCNGKLDVCIPRDSDLACSHCFSFMILFRMVLSRSFAISNDIFFILAYEKNNDEENICIVQNGFSAF